KPKETIVNNKQTIFITGSSSGLGKAAAKLFAVRGWNVIATMRTPEKTKELNDIDGLTKYALDVTKADQVKQAAEKVGPKTVVVLNNAGYGLAGPLEGLTDEQIPARVQHESDGHGSHDPGLPSALPGKAGGTLHKHSFDRRYHRLTFQFELYRNQVGH